MAYALYCASGIAALVVETTWLRWFELLFGATAPAASATLVAFLAGNAAGAAAGARWHVRRPLATYGAIELAAGGFALLVPVLLSLFGSGLAAAYDPLSESPAFLAALRFAIALLATFPASFCFGATFPVIATAVVPQARALGRQGSGLYAGNLLGAALGAALAAFALPFWLGVSGTYAVGVGILGVVGVTALVSDRMPEGEAPVRPPDRRRPAPKTPPLLLALAALSGVGSFAAQVLYVHAFAQVLNQSVYAFGAVLACVLASLAAGAGIASLCERRGWLDPRTLTGAALVGTGLSLTAFPALLFASTNGLDYVGADSGGAAGYVFASLWTVALSAGVPLLLGALVLPATFSIAGRRTKEGAPAAHLGRLAAANTLGAIAGALIAPWALLPLAGPWGSFLALGLLYAVPGLFLGDPSRRARRVRGFALGAVGAVVWIAANPLHRPAVKPELGERVLYAASGPAGEVAVVERGGERLVRVDNHYALGGTSQRTHEERQGHLPLVLHPDARRVVFVGTATAISAGAAVAHPVEEIVLVEIVPAVSDAARRFFAGANRRVHDDPRTRVVLDDARNYLAATNDSFDVVVADLFVPWRSGASSLYAREHFETVRARLAPGGLFCQWLPLYQLSEPELRTIAATFLDVFPRSAVFRGDFFGAYPIAALVGFEGAPAAPAAISRAAARLGAAGETDRWIADPLGIWALYAGPLSPLAADLAEVPRNSDDRPRVQYLAARSHAGGDRGKLERFVGLDWAGFGNALAAEGRSADPVFPDLSEEARRASEGGALFQMAGALWVSGRREEAARAVAAAAERIPRRLLADAPADPTAAELWPDS